MEHIHTEQKPSLKKRKKRESFQVVAATYALACEFGHTITAANKALKRRAFENKRQLNSYLEEFWGIRKHEYKIKF